MAKARPRKSKPKGPKQKGGMPAMPGAPGKGGEMNDMLAQVQAMQQGMAEAQQELKDLVVEATAGGGMVTVKATGEQEVTEIEIDPEAVDPDDVDMLQDIIVAGVNEALRKAKEESEARMNEVTGGLDLGALGGLGDMLG